MKFQKGKPRHKKAGRRKGTPNKVTLQIRDILEQAFEGVGGMETFVAWGKKNPALFYSLWIKILPKNFEIAGVGGGAIQSEVSVKFINEPDKQETLIRRMIEHGVIGGEQLERMVSSHGNGNGSH